MPRANFLYLNLGFVPLIDEAPRRVILIRGRPAAAGRPKFGRSWPSRGPLKRAPPAPPGRHADTRRVRGVDNDAPLPRLMLFAVRSARPPLQAPTAKSGLRERLPRRRAA